MALQPKVIKAVLLSIDGDDTDTLSTTNIADQFATDVVSPLLSYVEQWVADPSNR